MSQAMERRKFVAATTAALSASAATTTPVRATLLRPGYWGTQYLSLIHI